MNYRLYLFLKLKEKTGIANAAYNGSTENVSEIKSNFKLIKHEYSK